MNKFPALVCDECGESWFKDNVAEQLEQVVSEVGIKHPVGDSCSLESGF